MIKTRYHIWRVSLVGILAVFLSLVMVVRLARLQLSAASAIDNGISGTVATKSYTVKTPSMRGMVYDRYGRPLITNTIIYNIVFDYTLWDRSNQNDIILKLVDICSDYGFEYTDSLPLSMDEPEYTDKWTTEENRSRILTNFIKDRDWDPDISASDLTESFRQYYGISEGLGYREVRLLSGIRYEMQRASFSAANTFTFFKDIGIELAVMLNDISSELPGIRTTTSYIRQYNTKYAAHILGRVGPIFAEEYESLSALGYGMNDIVGKDGVEKAFEQYLRGIDGYTKYLIDEDGRIVDITANVDPSGGSNIMLTIDLKLQAAVEEALASQINLMVAEGLEDESKPQDVGGGAAVVIDVKTGDILSIASYPSFDITRFSAIYNDLLDDALKPMFNRAISGIYSPGSVFKMVPSVAGLELGIITPSTVITCTGVYRYYNDYTPSCWIYTQYRTTHGDETVVEALRDSCNIFFFDLGRQIGIDKLSTYARLFGLGDYTGIELPGESKGYVASPEAKRALENSAWVDGDTLQAAIGQSSNLFTPLQLANYIATLSNGGTRYESHLLKYVASNDFSKVELANQSVIAGRLELSDLTFETVMEGMSQVTENGTASSVFNNYSVHVGGKTGSAQVSDGTANSVFAAFAPFDDPEIAVVVIVEHGGSGNRIAPIARSIFENYFALQNSLSYENPENTLIN